MKKGFVYTVFILALLGVSSIFFKELSSDLAWSEWLAKYLTFYLAVSLFAFLGLWLFGEIGKKLNLYFPKIPKDIGFFILAYFAIIMLIRIRSTTGHFANFDILSLNSFLTIISVPLLGRAIERLFFFNLDLIDQRFASYLTYLIVGALSYWLIFFVCQQMEIYWVGRVGNLYHMGNSLSVPLEGLFLWGTIANARLLDSFRKRYQSLLNKDKQLAEIKKNQMLTKAELDGLQARLNPHFLYNSLNSIASLAQTEPQKSESMAIALSDFYKYSTNRYNEHLISIPQELEIVASYLDIEKIRFGARLHYQVVNALSNDRDWKIPHFILQPLVENAIKYGYNSEQDLINIRIDIKEDFDRLSIIVADEGKPFSEKLDLGYGLSSVQKKLRLIYGDKAELSFQNVPFKHVLIQIKG